MEKTNPLAGQPPQAGKAIGIKILLVSVVRENFLKLNETTMKSFIKHMKSPTASHSNLKLNQLLILALGEPY